MKNWKFWLKMVLPFAEAAGEEYVNQDDNETGPDDIKGQTLLYIVKLVKALIADKPMPKAPSILR